MSEQTGRICVTFPAQPEDEAVSRFGVSADDLSKNDLAALARAEEVINRIAGVRIHINIAASFAALLLLVLSASAQQTPHVYIGAHGSLTSQSLSYDKLFGASFGGAFVTGRTVILGDFDLDRADKTQGKGTGFRADFGVRRFIGERRSFVEGRIAVSGVSNAVYAKNATRALVGGGMTLSEGDLILSSHAILPLSDENRVKGVDFGLEGFKLVGKRWGFRGKARASWVHFENPHRFSLSDPLTGTGVVGDVSGGIFFRF